MQWCGTKLGAGGNSGFQALNLAAVAGASRVILLGYDMQWTGGKTHFHGDHGKGLSNPEQQMLKSCAKSLDAAAAELEARGVEVINCTRDTALKAYRRAKIEDVI